MHDIEKFTVENLTVKIYPDEIGDHECPIEDMNDSDGDGVKFVTFQKRSTLSDYHDFESPEAALEWAKEKGWKVFNLFYYEHGLCQYRATRNGNPFSCPWDSGQAGFIFIDPVAFENVDLANVADSWCKAVTTWCNGDYYGYVVEDEDGNSLGSCWGYDDIDYCKSEATAEAKSLAAGKAEQMRKDQQAAFDDMYGQF